MLMKKTRMRKTPFLSRRPLAKDTVARVPASGGDPRSWSNKGEKTKAVLMEEKLKDGK